MKKRLHLPTLLLSVLFFACLCSTTTAQTDLSGFWDQYLYDHIEGKWMLSGTFRVFGNQESGWHMLPHEIPVDASLIFSDGISDMSVSEQKWSFESDWGEYGIGQFELTMVSNRLYVGYAHEKEEKDQITRNLWIKRIPDEREAKRVASEENEFIVLDGIWECIWSNPEGYVFIGFMDMTVTKEGVLEGRIAWELGDAPVDDPYYTYEKYLQVGIEYVHGQVNLHDTSMEWNGYKKHDPAQIIGLDTYRVSLYSSLLIGKTKGPESKWDGRFSAAKVK